MGLFDKKIKKPSDFDDASVGETPQPPPAIAANKPSKPLEATDPNYGINKAIELMRMLPDDNIELVVRVVKTTLESTNIKVATIIKDALRKQAGIEGRIDVLKKDIAGLESEIATRRTEIAGLEADHKETSTVKDRLMLAERLTGGGGVERAAAEARAATPTPPGGSATPPATPQRSGTPSTSPPAAGTPSRQDPQR
jgi:hypothetical protein